MTAKFKSKEGFTLMEVMFTAVLIAVAVGGSMGMMGWIIQATGYNKHLTEATTMAHDKLEELIGGGYDTASSGSTLDGMYSMKWAVSGGSSLLTGSTTAKKLTTTVAWGNGRGKSKKIEITSMLGENKSASTEVSGFQDYVVNY